MASVRVLVFLAAAMFTCLPVSFLVLPISSAICFVMVFWITVAVAFCRHFITTRDGEGRLNQVIAVCLNFFAPPLGVYWRFGIGSEMLLCIVLTFVGYLPGVFYGLYIVLFQRTDGEVSKL